MRRLPAGVAISAAVHAVAIAWVSIAPPDPPPAPPPPAPRIELVDVTPAPIAPAPPVEVTLLDDDAGGDGDDAAPAIALIDPRRELRASRAASAAAEPGDAGKDVAEPAGTTPPARHPLLDMRKDAPVRLTIGVPTGRRDGRARAPETFGPDLDSGQLAPDGGGTHRSDQGPFTAKVDRDGSVRLRDKRNVAIRFALPSTKAIGDAIGDWYEDDRKPVGFLGPPEGTGPRLNRDESSGADRKPDHGSTVPLIRGSFDVTDALMRHAGQDPYASNKLRFLDSTRDQRVQIGRRHRQQQLERAAEIMRHNVDRLLASVIDPAARRAGLFELWDECAETGGEELVTAGRAARSLVLGVIRARFPAGSETAYTDAELAALNRRRLSRAPFAPYD